MSDKTLTGEPSSRNEEYKPVPKVGIGNTPPRFVKVLPQKVAGNPSQSTDHMN